MNQFHLSDFTINSFSLGLIIVISIIFLRKLKNLESHNSLKPCLSNVRGLHSNVVECESFPESNSPDIPVLCETNFYDSIDHSNFFVSVIFI